MLPKYTEEEIDNGIITVSKPTRTKYELGKRGRYSTSVKPITQTEQIRKVYVTHDKHPLTYREARFIDEYMNCGDKAIAAEKAGFAVKNFTNKGNALLKKSYIADEIAYRTEIYASELIADRDEILEYFTAVMRGEVKDQFGLDAPLSERTSAAKELKKVFIDDAVKHTAAQAQQVVVNIDMSRDDDNTSNTIDIQQISD